MNFSRRNLMMTAGVAALAKIGVGSSARAAEHAHHLPTPANADAMKDMPKGGDLHHHLTGAVYAESYINYAVEDGDCIDRVTYKILAPPCDRP